MPETDIYARIVSETQGDAEWLQVRCGCVGASRVADVCKKRKRGTEELACRADYRWDLVIERLTGNSTPSYVSPEMEWGIATEPLARAAYEIAAGVEVERVGFVLHPTIKWAGASPDGIIRGNPLRLVELKCPKSSTHLGYFLDDDVPEQYKPQMMWQMAVCGAESDDFVSYDPRLPEEFQLVIRRFNRDDAVIAEMEREVTAFLAEVAETLEQIKERAKGKTVLEQQLEKSLQH